MPKPRLLRSVAKSLSSDDRRLSAVVHRQPGSRLPDPGPGGARRRDNLHRPLPGRANHGLQLAAAFAFLRRGDRLAVWRLDRLGRNMPHLIQLVRDIEARGCQLVSLTKNLETDSPGGKLVFTVFATLAQFESDVNSERTREAHKAAKANGRRRERKSTFHDPAYVRAVRALGLAFSFLDGPTAPGAIPLGGTDQPRFRSPA